MADGIEIKGLNLWYGQKQALKDINLEIPGRSVTAIIGPSGCGKSTLLRCINRMNDIIDGCKVIGHILMSGQDVNSSRTDLIELRRKVGMIFQKATPFPFTVQENVVFGCRMAGLRDPGRLQEVAERSLRRAALYEELKDRLDSSALCLSGGQQQRLCIARAIAMGPEVLLFDEPCSALDPIATRKIEDLIADLKRDFNVVIVTHNMQQARRISDHTVFMLDGEMVEYGPTHHMFTSPGDPRTMDYVTGRFG